MTESIEIYSSKKKAFLVLLASITFVVGGIFMFLNADQSYSHRSPIYLKTAAILCTLVFGVGIFFSIKVILKNQLILIIDNIGLNIYPKKSDYIYWRNIIGIKEIKIHSTNIVVIDIDNSEYWIQKESNLLRKQAMKFSFRNYGSPFNLSANSMQANHIELMEILNENLSKYKYNAQPTFQ